MRTFARYVLPIAAAAMLGGCNVQESIADATKEVARFHANLDAQRYDNIWREASPELRKTTKQQDFFRLLSAVHGKLGLVTETKQTGWNANATTSGSFVTITMQTRFERGSGAEQFTYRKGDGDQLALVAYGIQSQDMMLN